MPAGTVLPTSEQNLPGGQSKHWVMLDNCDVLPIVPAGQGVGKLLPAGQYTPREHGVGDKLPSPGQYDPAGHSLFITMGGTRPKMHAHKHTCTQLSTNPYAHYAHVCNWKWDPTILSFVFAYTVHVCASVPACMCVNVPECLCACAHVCMCACAPVRDRITHMCSSIGRNQCNNVLPYQQDDCNVTGL
jgi:hypothetical protein